MTDPRNVAHDKKVQQEKKHQGKEIAPGADQSPQPGKKTPLANHGSDATTDAADGAPAPDGDKRPA